ncbi:MAG TPA: 4-hydroxy-tetrahydrodipicolinate synthase [Enteractinococcus helveticum]|uniref:4-hydroxy-tetrahydrodipicolinate synthase n=1 Tax=Enteractinococcus helveticum TaxID=1837282 RepID=A0A921K9Y3_9MICC|nr:4-hydroxy-tetrahydrodipicolinate synthase [Enteractinococcus helveticum]HJF15564.1 4-hydroxy-tetrahydrodipicolinate synthase [Enteractinococcus helveticum]
MSQTPSTTRIGDASMTEPFFGTMIPAMVTPFTDDGELDVDAAQSLATHLVDNGADGLVVTGTTGETSTLTDDENIKVFEAVVEAVGGRAKVIAGTGMNDTAHSAHLSQRAAAAGVDGLLLVTPYYNKPNQAGIKAHFEHIASSTDLPVMLYDIPGRSVMPIEPETIIALAEHPNIIALKDAKADYQSTTIVLANTDLLVYSGDDGLTLPLMAAGAVGVVSVTGHVAPRTYRELVDAANAGDFATARAKHFELDHIQRAIMTHVQGAVAAKTVLHWQGIIPSPRVRLPLVAVTDQEAASIKADLAAGGITF